MGSNVLGTVLAAQDFDVIDKRLYQLEDKAGRVVGENLLLKPLLVRTLILSDAIRTNINANLRTNAQVVAMLAIIDIVCILFLLLA
jgi:hypothetical protein